LQGLAFGPAGFGEAGGVDDAAADAGGGALFHQRLHGFDRDCKDGAIDGFRQGGDAAETGDAVERIRLRIDAESSALEIF